MIKKEESAEALERLFNEMGVELVDAGSDYKMGFCKCCKEETRLYSPNGIGQVYCPSCRGLKAGKRR